MEALQPTDPSTIGDYRLLGRLGGGGTGLVYLGATRTGQLVAVKMIRAEIAADPAFRARFAREVAAAERVGRRWTAAVIAADAEAEAPWLATEYVPGPSLQEVVSRDGPLPAPAAAELARRLAEAIGAIHAAGLVHRDVTPANVLMSPDGPVLIGLALARPSATDSAHPATVAGTPSYLSPEQIRGKPARPPSDVYSLGATLAYAVTGRGPFDAGGSDDVVDRVLTASPDLAGAPAPLHDLILGCMAKRPARRPTPAQLTKALAAPATGADGPSGGWQPPGGQLATAPASGTGGSWVRRSREGDILARRIVWPLIGIAAVPAMVFPFGLLVAVFMLSVPRALADHTAESVRGRPPGPIGPVTLLFAPFRATARGLVAGFALLGMTVAVVLFAAILVVLSTGVLGPIASWALGDASGLPRVWFNGFFIKLAASVLILALPEALGPGFGSWLGAGVARVQETATDLHLVVIWLAGVLIFVAALLWLPTLGWWPLPYGR